MEWADCVREKQLWEADYAERREELDAKWEQQADASEWRRLNKNDKERFLDSFRYEVNGRTIVLEQGIANSPEALGLTVWDASLVLTSHLESLQKAGAFRKGASVLELGTGCGVVSIAAAALGAQVTATDCSWVIPLTTINAEKNKEAIIAAGGSVSCKALTWGNQSDWEDYPTFDYIVAADCVYTDTSVPELLRTIHSIATEDTMIIFAFQEHNPDAARMFWNTVDKYFSWARVDSKRIDSKYQESGINLLTLKKILTRDV